jgi:ribonuclease E
MLINAQRPEEVRMAIVTDGVLDTFEVAAAESGLSRGNIYRGIVANVHPALDAAFVNYGADKDGLLRSDDIVPSAYHRQPQEGERHPRIERIVERGKPVLVQVVRDGVGHKGSLLTSNISLAGRYLVLMPFDDVRGVSRKAEDEDVRKAIKERLADMVLPEGTGVIARTNALDQPKTSLNRDLTALLRLWKKVRAEASSGRGPKLIYSDQDLIVQALRDALDSTIAEVLVDDDEAYERVRAYMASFMPRAKTKLVRYAERMPLFSKFDLEQQIDRIFQRKVDLPGGGSIVIDATEALTAIDVNSGRATRGASQEEAVTAVNLEAGREVARQLRLRDIGGLVVVDFIDMRSNKHQRDVEKTLRDAMKDDKARFTVSRLSPNGLIEINRQRLKKALALRSYRDCPTCSGTGTIASPELVSLNLLRRIETRAVTGQLKHVRVDLHPELADAIQNDRRHQIADLEREFDIRVEIIASPSLHRSEERIEFVKRDPAEAAERLRQKEAAALSLADLGQDEGRGGDHSAAEDDDETPHEANGETKKKRRRRGGRKRRKADPEPSSDGANTDGEPGSDDEHDGSAAEPHGEADAAPAVDDGGDDAPAPRKRRRRGGRKRRSGSADNGEAASEEQAASPEGDDRDGAPGLAASHEPGDGEEPQGAADPPKKRRRRGGRRRKKPTAEGEGAGDDARPPTPDQEP